VKILHILPDSHFYHASHTGNIDSSWSHPHQKCHRYPHLPEMATQTAEQDFAARNLTAQSEKHRTLYQSYLDHCNAHDLEAMKSFYSIPLSVNDTLRSPAEVTAQFEPLLTAFPDWHWEVKNLTIEGEYLSLHFRVTGTHRGNFQGNEPTGRRVTASQFTLYRVQDGKFSEVWDLLDIQSLIEQTK
jgi:predicted ester cyclase